MAKTTKTTKTLSEKMESVDTSSAMYAMDEELDINVSKKKAKSTKKVMIGSLNSWMNVVKLILHLMRNQEMFIVHIENTVRGLVTT